MTQMTTAVVWVAVFVGVVLGVVAIVGALKRWAWAYYAILGLLGLGLLSLPANAFDIASGQVPMPGFPTWFYAEAVVSSLVSVALFAWMLIAMIRFGPWAMRRAA